MTAAEAGAGVGGEDAGGDGAGGGAGGGGAGGGGAGGGEESLTYEELLETLEELTRRMADGAIGIEEVVELYERAGRLHAMAAQRLARVQARIEALAGEAAPDVGAGTSGDGGDAG